MEPIEADIIVATKPPPYIMVGSKLAIGTELMAQIESVKIECRPSSGEPFAKIVFVEGASSIGSLVISGTEDLEMFLPWFKHTQKGDE